MLKDWKHKKRRIQEARTRAKENRLEVGEERLLFPKTEKPPKTPNEKALFQSTVKDRLFSKTKVKQHTKKYQQMAEVLEKMCEALLVGSSIEMAASYAGVQSKILKEWLAKGHAKPKTAYGAFLRLLQEAVAMCDISDLKTLDKASRSGDWEAAIARLKLRSFGTKEASEKAPVEIKIIQYTAPLQIPPIPMSLPGPVIEVEASEPKQIKESI